MADHKIYIFAGGHNIAEGEVMAADLDSLNLREKMQMPEVPFPKEIPELSFNVKISKRRLRRLRQMAMGSKPRLPRKLKKAARHADFDVFDLQMQTDALSDRDRVNFTIEYDHRLHTRPAGYPRTKWVQRLIHRWLREMNQMHKLFVKRAMLEQYLDQHPGMLTYDPAPLTPSPEAVDMIRRGDVTMNPYYPHAQEIVLDRKHLTNLANIINNKEE